MMLPAGQVDQLPSWERSLADKVVWVTGAGRGLGRAIAAAVGRSGARLAVTARSAEQLATLGAELSDYPGEVRPFTADVSDAAAVREVAERIAEEWGTLDVLVNMAGISPTVVRSENLSDAAWHDVIDVNLSGTFYCCREAGRLMIASGGGSIVNVSSVHGSVGVPRMCAYAASKGGVEMLTKALAVEWADRGVRVNCLAPGYFRTAMTEPYLASSQGAKVRAAIPLGRVGETEELVGAALFLASDASSYVTGTTLLVDGGWTAQ
ncbi:SDR family NAD(P)-dependent oxidoreductase [Micromonospora sp. NPDC047740]|uniref:SDR family NAD(P)-dependent oxidoreductase n=1 Tax=Micromonospora sp. NPDC047740 TaxID=3364254 RepID=UPI00372108F3